MGVTYFACDPLHSYFDEPQNNEFYFSNEQSISLRSRKPCKCTGSDEKFCMTNTHFELCKPTQSKEILDIFLGRNSVFQKVFKEISIWVEFALVGYCVTAD